MQAEHVEARENNDSQRVQSQYVYPFTGDVSNAHSRVHCTDLASSSYAVWLHALIGDTDSSYSEPSEFGSCSPQSIACKYRSTDMS